MISICHEKLSKCHVWLIEAVFSVCYCYSGKDVSKGCLLPCFFHAANPGERYETNKQILNKMNALMRIYTSSIRAICFGEEKLIVNPEEQERLLKFLQKPHM